MPVFVKNILRQTPCETWDGTIFVERERERERERETRDEVYSLKSKYTALFYAQIFPKFLDSRSKTPFCRRKKTAVFHAENRTERTKQPCWIQETGQNKQNICILYKKPSKTDKTTLLDARNRTERKKQPRLLKETLPNGHPTKKLFKSIHIIVK